MFSDGHAANLRRGVNLSTMRIKGLKSHDYHIWIERLLLVMVWGYVPEYVWLVLVELSNFFHHLCAKELSRAVIINLERMAPVLLCKLEKIFPPSFFNLMQHLILHLPYEARMGGGMQGRWCYPIERCLKVHRTKCKNKCKIKASIAEAYILEEVSNFTTTYYGNNLPSMHNPPPHYNASKNEPQHFSRATRKCKYVTPRPWSMKSGALSCYMCWATFSKWSRTCGKFSTNLFSGSHYSASNPLVSHWCREFHHQFWSESREPTPQETETLLRQGVENGMPNFISWFKHKVLSNLART
jgi:hypothetical protein